MSRKYSRDGLFRSLSSESQGLSFQYARTRSPAEAFSLAVSSHERTARLKPGSGRRVFGNRPQAVQPYTAPAPVAVQPRPFVSGVHDRHRERLRHSPARPHSSPIQIGRVLRPASRRESRRQTWLRERSPPPSPPAGNTAALRCASSERRTNPNLAKGDIFLPRTRC